MGDVHPMVPVPEAIRTVIRETGRVLLEHPHSSLTVSSEAAWNVILDRVLDKDVTMSEPGYPPYNASIMDGFAIRTNDEFPRDDGEDWTHQVVDKVYAGDQAPPKQLRESGNLPLAYYITTGAVVPDSCNCVVPIEECQVSPDKKQIRIKPSATIRDQIWIRPIGCDIPAGSVVLPRGHRMDPVALGLLKQSGAGSIQIKRPIVVGVLSTGNELIWGTPQDNTPGKIPDVNRPILLSLLSSFGNCETVDLGMERDDDVQAMARTIDSALQKCDVIITTGGISMGETDIVEQVLVEHCGGKLHFGRMHMKPGRYGGE
jgi:molybdenum cofactor synthesis domain-containing protein